MRLGILALSVLSAPAIAQDGAGDLAGFDAHGFQLSALDADTRDPLTLQRPGRMHAEDGFAGAILEFAESPLIGTSPDGESIPVVDDLFALNLSGGTVFHERVRLDLAVPIYLSSIGPDGPRGAGIGDFRLGGMLLLIQPTHGDDGLGVGISPYIDFPTGDDREFLGQSNIAGGAILSASGAFDDLTVTVNAGTQINPSLDRANLTGADVILLGLGGGYRATPNLGVNYEIRGLLPLELSSSAGTGTPFEGILTGRYVDDSGGFAVGGLAIGLTPGVGAATFRLLLGGGFGVASGEAFDTDGDGVVDLEDECPDVAGTEEFNGCAPDVQLWVTVTYRGQDVAGAEIRVEGPVTHEAVSDGKAWGFEVAKDSMWRGSATLGKCLAGDTITQVGDEDLTMEIALEYQTGARLRIAVLDVNGNTVDDVNVMIESDDRNCKPSDIPAFDRGGRIAFDIGVGVHTVMVDAPGFQMFMDTFTLEHSAEREVFVLLNPK